MRILTGSLLTLVALVAGCQPAMQDFTSTQLKFKARFPGKPKEQSQSGPFNTTMTMFAVESRNGVYMVGVADLPIPTGESDAMIQNRLDGSRDGAVRNIDGTLKTSGAITLNGKYPGREFVASVTKPQQGQVRAKIYMVGTRLYQVMVIGTDSYATNSQATEFLNSFQVIE